MGRKRFSGFVLIVEVIFVRLQCFVPDIRVYVFSLAAWQFNHWTFNFCMGLGVVLTCFLL